jgi:molecular chaperone GrpE
VAEKNGVPEETTVEEVEVKETAVEEEETTDESIEEEHVCDCAAELERKNAQLANQLLRLKADFENFRRRSRAQMEDLKLSANEELLQDLLPVLDNFERALESGEKSCSDSSFLEGVRMVHQGLMHTLNKYGLECIEAEGKPFDPEFHDAVVMEGEGGDHLQVLSQVQTGYLLNGRVIRHTKVLVGQAEGEE